MRGRRISRGPERGQTVEPFERIVSRGAFVDFRACTLTNRPRHQDLIGSRRSLGARGSIDHGADCREVVMCAAEFAEVDFAAVDADSDYRRSIIP